MKKIIAPVLAFAVLTISACNNNESESTTTDELKTDQNKNNDTRTVDPSDTLNKMDTGNYNKMSDSLRN